MFQYLSWQEQCILFNAQYYPRFLLRSHGNPRKYNPSISGIPLLWTGIPCHETEVQIMKNLPLKPVAQIMEVILFLLISGMYDQMPNESPSTGSSSGSLQAGGHLTETSGYNRQSSALFFSRIHRQILMFAAAFGCTKMAESSVFLPSHNYCSMRASPCRLKVFRASQRSKPEAVLSLISPDQ